MERSNDKVRHFWNNNRSASIVFLGLATIALMYFVRVSFDFVNQTIINRRLNELRSIIRTENQELENLSELLNDGEYYSIYVREEFQFNGDNVIRIPSN